MKRENKRMQALQKSRETNKNRTEQDKNLRCLLKTLVSKTKTLVSTLIGYFLVYTHVEFLSLPFKEKLTSLNYI